MKKIIASMLLVLAALCATPAQAQIKFGLKAGLNVTSMSFNSDVFQASNRAGFFVGPTVKIAIPLGGLAVDGSVLYDQREAKIATASIESSSSLKFQSINIPINLRYGWGLGSLADVFVFAGPQFAFRIGDKEQNLGTSNWTLKNSEFSVNVGVGATVINHVQITLNYNIACGKTANLTLGSVGDAIKNTNSRANAWQIGVAYFF